LITVTLDRYGHHFPQLDEAIALSFGVELRSEHETRAKEVVHTSFGHEACQSAVQQVNMRLTRGLPACAPRPIGRYLQLLTD
jgi:hypothetical protein